MSEEKRIKQLDFEESGNIPNNDQLPVIVVRNALAGEESDFGDVFERRFRQNGWTGCWMWGVYGFHHYHSTAHEALGVARGSAEIRLGGPDGSTVEVSPGDLIILPAGTGHKCLSSTDDFLVVGCYPQGQEDYDTIREDTRITDEIRGRIRNVPLPSTDPLQGSDGPVVRLWKSD